MVLARCCPRWVSAGVAAPQPQHLSRHPDGVATLVYYSLAFQGALADLFGSDYPAAPVRHEVTWVYWVYHRAARLTLRSFTPVVATCSDLWPSAGWFERELWEMFGVGVHHHGDLRRLVTDYGFVGYPLRKDFPVGGYLEVRYSEVARRVVSRPVRFTQEFRAFDFRSPWLA